MSMILQDLIELLHEMLVFLQILEGLKLLNLREVIEFHLNLEELFVILDEFQGLTLLNLDKLQLELTVVSIKLKVNPLQRPANLFAQKAFAMGLSTLIAKEF